MLLQPCVQRGGNLISHILVGKKTSKCQVQRYYFTAEVPDRRCIELSYSYFHFFSLFFTLKLYRRGVRSTRRPQRPLWQSHLDYRPYRWHHQLCSQVARSAIKCCKNLCVTVLALFLSLLLFNYFYLLIRFFLGLSSLSGIIRQRWWNWTDNGKGFLWV